MASQSLGVFERLSQSHTRSYYYELCQEERPLYQKKKERSCIDCFLDISGPNQLLSHSPSEGLNSWESVSFVETTFDSITHPRGTEIWHAALFGCATCINTAVTETLTPFPVITAGPGGSLNSERGAAGHFTAG